jgi:hypothetical protein
MLCTARWGIGGLAVLIVLMLTTTWGVAQYSYPRDYGPQPTGAALQTEVKTAQTHAGFASKYDTLKEVTLHLHHVVNCLVGSKDKMFDASAGNPCEGQGNGIVADIPASMGTDAQYEARWAAHIANDALSMKTVEEAKAGAHIVALALDDLQKMIK